MRTAHLAALALLATGVRPLHAEDLSKNFRAVFERTFRAGHTHSVVVQKGLPTTSIYGVKGDQTDAHYSIDCIAGEWKTSQGWLDIDQVAVDFLDLGEVMELASISYKNNRVDLRMVSLAAHKVTRGEGFGQNTKREPVATNFKFFLPFPDSKELTEQDVPAVIAFIEQYVKPFADEASAGTFAARLKLEGEQAAPASRPVAAAAPAAATALGASGKKAIEKGMTALEVIEILGKPEKEVTFESKSRWTYADLTVIFENGRVAEVRF